MNTERALDILVEEANRGLLDRDLIQVFIDAKVFHVIDTREYSTSTEFQSFSHHPCDVDLHEHSH